MRVLLGQLGANGDCLHATVLARQIKADHPDAHLTWAVSGFCRRMIENNPDVDEIWEVPVDGWDGLPAAWRAFEAEARRQERRGAFDRVILSQVWPGEYQNFDGTVRPSVMRALGRPVSEPVRNVIRLTDEERGRVDAFSAEARLGEFGCRILFECSSRSAQSFMTPDLAQAVAERLYLIQPDTAVVFSTDQPMDLRDFRSRSARALSLREVAGLTHWCTLVVGCGSGASVAAISTAAKRLPSVQVLSPTAGQFGSVAHDLEFFEDGADRIVETCEADPEALARLIVRVARRGPDAAREEGDWRVPVGFGHYRQAIEDYLLKPWRALDAAWSLQLTAARYGWTRELLDFGRTRVEPQLQLDPGSAFPPGRRAADAFRARLADAEPAEAPVQRTYRELGDAAVRPEL